ncbi:hypothetical protein [Stenotrophomonas phage BUCT555]|nr:hypothetical protein [Stenotrophomonas phage BUCT555]
MQVLSHNQYVASINRMHKAADGYTPDTPWLLLHNTGRVDRFARQGEAKKEARKSWPRVTFVR